LAVSLLFSPPLPRERRPRLAELYFDVAIDASPAPDVQRVLSVRASGPSPGAVTSCTADLAGRADGLGSLTRIYNRGAAVAVSVPDHAGGAVFAGWDVIGAVPDEAARREPALSMAVDDHVFAVSRWTRAREGTEPTVVFATVIDA